MPVKHTAGGKIKLFARRKRTVKFDKKVNLCEIGPTTLNGVKFEAEKVISPNSHEHINRESYSIFN